MFQLVLSCECGKTGPVWSSSVSLCQHRVKGAAAVLPHLSRRLTNLSQWNKIKSNIKCVTNARAPLKMTLREPAQITATDLLCYFQRGWGGISKAGILTSIFLRLYSTERSQRHILGLSACPIIESMISQECLEGIPSSFGIDMCLDSRMKWLGFGGQWSKAKVAIPSQHTFFTSWTQYLWKVSRDRLEIWHKHPHGLKDDRIPVWCQRSEVA